MSWKLKRVKQCDKYPWKVSTNPHDIPDGYSEELHRALERTIAEPRSLSRTDRVMACHVSIRQGKKPTVLAGS